ncbi:hypothetical protein ACIG3E_24005 [Streptomyces sp. NPDC053474]|uniref:hypothetical protein n=1 Tax=Streptomyces sp. NPDC053474 TaxID=3365704 RepID=UPI0037CF1508
MRRSTILIPAGVLAVAGGLTGAVLWLTQPTYDDRVNDCARALKEPHTERGEGRPEECVGVKDGDFSALVVDAALDESGWVDENGDFDKNKMLDDVGGDLP